MGATLAAVAPNDAVTHNDYAVAHNRAATSPAPTVVTLLGHIIIGDE
jgi:hypothetical protein